MSVEVPSTRLRNMRWYAILQLVEVVTAPLHREAKIWAKNLGELLKTKAPWEQPVESLRLK